LHFSMLGGAAFSVRLSNDDVPRILDHFSRLGVAVPQPFDPVSAFSKCQAETERWRARKMSNFEYIMLLN